ncbi:MAG: SUMF1/EgtB/PvdO family nonheme iron enzyme [Acidobacteria bacterium]|nr:SUMF1/EgtB/PvdO family nonheme iron enzyme [Acidobacteriota bacterium]
MKRKVALVIVSILAGCLLGPSLSSAQRQRGQSVQRKAARRNTLVIGNSNYGQGPLRNPVNDARAMGNILKTLGFDVSLLFDQNLQQMDEAIRTFGQKIRSGGIGLFYFAGHGLQVDGVNYLAPVGARVEKEEDVKFETLEIGKVTAEMEAAKNDLNIMILDACRNNPFARAFRSPSSGLAPINAPSGTYIAFATAPGTTASDGEGGYGLYTKELLVNLGQPGLRLEDIFIRTRVAVKKKSNNKQVPWENGALEGVVILNESISPAPIAAAKPQLPAIGFSVIPLATLRSEKFITASVDEKGRVTRREAGPAQYYVEDLGNGVKLEMVRIRGGSFLMGSPYTESGRNMNEEQHPVQVSSFWMGRYEVTQAQWRAVMGRLLPFVSKPENHLALGDDLPILCVDWLEVQEFIAELNKLLKLEPGKGYRLPREAEWEYAARSGTTTPFPYGSTIFPGLENYDWSISYANGPRDRSREAAVLMKVGSTVANPFGIYDMLGNATEWCEDWYGPYPLPKSGEQLDPAGPTEGQIRVIRGCSYSDFPESCRSAARSGLPPAETRGWVSFRLVRK